MENFGFYGQAQGMGSSRGHAIGWPNLGQNDMTHLRVVVYESWAVHDRPWPNLNPLRASPEDGFSFNDFKTNLDFRMLPSAVFPGKSLKKVTLNHHLFPLYGTRYVLSIETRSLVHLKLEVIGSSQTWTISYRKKLYFLGMKFEINHCKLCRVRGHFLCSRLNQNHIPRHAPYHEHSKCTNTQSDWQCMHDISINWVIHLQKTSKRLVSSRIKVIQGHNDMTHFLVFG